MCWMLNQILGCKIKDKKVCAVKLLRDSDSSFPCVYHKHMGYYKQVLQPLSFKNQTNKRKEEAFVNKWLNQHRQN